MKITVLSFFSFLYSQRDFVEMYENNYFDTQKVSKKVI